MKGTGNIRQTTKDMNAVKLGKYCNYYAWKFDLTVDLSFEREQIVNYTITVKNQSFSYKFIVPKAQTPFRWAFYSCNGLSLGEVISNPLAMWKEFANRYRKKSLHLLVCVGDQIYTDSLLDICVM
jgi:hypothetical protein